MFARKRVVQAKQRRKRSRRFYGLSMRDVRSFLSSLIIPLVFGLITIFTTVYQLKQAERHWEGRMNLSHKQREQDWNISKMNREDTNQIADKQYREKVFLDYVKDIGDFLKENNGSLTENSLTHTLARVKTLNVLLQLSGLQQRHIVRFLSEAKQLTNTKESIALDISTAELSNIDFDQSSSFLTREKISLAGIHLQNSTFHHIRWLKDVNFSSARLSKVNFSSEWLDNFNFSSALLDNVKFSSVLGDVSFSSTVLYYVNFSFARLSKVNFSYAKLRNVNFSSASLDEVNFSPAQLYNVNFSSAGLTRVNISSTELFHVSFSSTVLYYVNFSSADLYDVNFSSAHLINANFSSADLYFVNFSSAQLNNVNFSPAGLYGVNFSSVWLDNVNFTSARLYHVNFSSAQFSDDSGASSFSRAHMTYTMFVECTFDSVDFSYANLKSSSFRGAVLNKTNFTLANLQKVDFTNATIDDSQLQSALSIRDAILPNGTLGRGHNLVRNGDPNCNITFTKQWQIRTGSIAVVVSRENLNECQFSLKSPATEGIMSQQILLLEFWNSSIWTNSTVEFKANMSGGVSIEMSGQSNDRTVIDKVVANSTQNRISMKLQGGMDVLEVVVKFSARTNEINHESIWCDNIELFIDYDILSKTEDKNYLY